MKPMTLDELRELAPGYVMGTLTLEEQHGFDVGMADDSMATALTPEIVAHRAAVEFLSTAHATTPPAGLKDRVMARIAMDRGAIATDQSARDANATDQSARVANATDQSARAEEPVRAPRPTVSSSSPLRDVPRRSSGRAGGRAGWWSSGALVLALAASLVFSVDLRTQVKSLNSQLAEQVALVTSGTSRLAAREKTLATLLGGGNDVTLVRLSPNQPAGPGMQVFWNVREGRAIVSASGLSQIARDRAYALWMIRDGKPVAIALFTPDASGRAVVQDIAVPTDLAGVAAFAVTEEPSAGSPQPTMTPFLVGAVPKS